MSRLRPPPSDSYGLTSRDDTRLLDQTTFSAFWNSVKANVGKFLDETDGAGVKAITRSLDSLTLASNSNRNASHIPKPTHLLSDLRKLREALIALRKQDDEAKQILLASVKVGILSHHNETYLPSLRTLLEQPPYPPSIHNWYALYLLFTLEDFSEFFAFATSHALGEYYTHLAQVLINGNYIAYMRSLEMGSRYDMALIVNSPADKRMKRKLVEVIGKCYYRVEVEWFNRLGTHAHDQWKREGDMYIIRRQQQKLQKAHS